MEKSLFDSKEKIDLGRKSFKERLLKSGKKAKIALILSLLLVSFFASDIALGAKGLGVTNTALKVLLPPKAETKEEVKKEDVPYAVKRELDSNLGDDVVKVKQKGQKGIKEIKYRVTYTDGKETRREIKSEILSQSPTDEIIIFGSQTALNSFSDSSLNDYLAKSYSSDSDTYKLSDISTSSEHNSTICKDLTSFIGSIDAGKSYCAGHGGVYDGSNPYTPSQSNNDTKTCVENTSLKDAYTQQYNSQVEQTKRQEEYAIGQERVRLASQGISCGDGGSSGSLCSTITAIQNQYKSQLDNLYANYQQQLKSIQPICN